MHDLCENWPKRSCPNLFEILAVNAGFSKRFLKYSYSNAITFAAIHSSPPGPRSPRPNFHPVDDPKGHFDLYSGVF